MKTLFVSLLVVFTANLVNAEEVDSVIINDKRTIHEMLSSYAQGLETEVLRRGLAFQFVPVVKEIVVSFTNHSEDPEFPACLIHYVAKLGSLQGPKVVDPPSMAGAIDPSVKREWGGNCQEIKDDYFSE